MFGRRLFKPFLLDSGEVLHRSFAYRPSGNKLNPATCFPDIKKAIPKIVEMFKEDSDEDVRISALHTCSAIAQGQNKMEALFFSQSIFLQLAYLRMQSTMLCRRSWQH
jgi:hypothetical protein